jgi:hypothetical protein
MALAAAFLVWISILAVIDARTASGCYDSGYANHRVTFDLSRYCVNRTDQTDIIVPFKERNDRD